MEQQQTKLSLIGLIAIVVGGIIGGGIFNIAKILAHQASLGAIIISWIISGIGILAIALTFKTLISVRPDLSNGIYSYTRSGFGEYAGFNIAWGYWMGNAIGNAVLAIMLNDAFGLFFPLLLKHSWPTLIFCSIFTWLFTFIVARGMKLAATINTLSTILKFSSLLLIIFLLFSFADYSLMDFDFWGKESHLGPLSDQINSTMLTTLFFFMGIEGAIVVSSRALRQADVGKATVIGYIICLFLNVIICILSFGFMPQSQLAQLNDPSLAQILGKGVGEWARIFVNVSVIIAVAGAWLVGTIIAAELPAQAARDGVLPAWFAKTNRYKAPIASLLITSAFIQLFFFLVMKAPHFYLLSIDISGILILPTYIFSAMFMVKSGLHKEIYQDKNILRQIAIIIGTTAVLYCLWVIYAGNIHLLLLSSGVYIIGILFYEITHWNDRKAGIPIFKITDRYVIGLLAAALFFSLLIEWKFLDFK